MTEKTKSINEISVKGALNLVYWPHSMNPLLCTSLGVYETMIVNYLHNWLEWKKKNPKRKGSQVTYKKGRYWVFKKLSEWAEEFPHIPPRTIRRALDNLKQREVISTGVFNKFKAVRTMWYSINYQTMIRLTKAWVCKRLQSGDWALTMWPQGPHAYVQGGHMHMSTVDKSRHVPTHIPTSCSETSSPDPKDTRSTSVRNKGQIQKKETAKEQYVKLQEKLSKKATVQTMIYFWGTLLTMYDVSSHTSFTGKERGMMKNLISYLQGAGVDPAEFLEYAVANWKEIRKKITWPDNPKKSRVSSLTPVFEELYYLRTDITMLWENHVAEPEVKTFSITKLTSVDDIPVDLSDSEKKRLKDQIEILGYADIKQT